jgi:putative protease
LGEWSHVYGSKATKRKIYVGKGLNYYSNLGVAEFLCEASDLKVGDEILITGPTTGIIQTIVKEIRVGTKPVSDTRKGLSFSLPIDRQIRRSDKLYKIVEASRIRLQ